MPGRQASFRRAGVFGCEATVLIGVAPHLEVQGPGSIRHQYAWVALLRKLYLFLSVVYRIPETNRYSEEEHQSSPATTTTRHRRGSGGNEKSGKEEKIQKDETAERDIYENRRFSTNSKFSI